MVLVYVQLHIIVACYGTAISASIQQVWNMTRWPSQSGLNLVSSYVKYATGIQANFLSTAGVSEDPWVIREKVGVEPATAELMGN